MPASPDTARGTADQVLRIYADAEALLLQALAKRLAAGIDGGGWQERKLAEVTLLRRDAQQVVDRLNVTGLAAVRQAVAEAYARGVAAALAELRAIGRRLTGTPLPTATAAGVTMGFGATNTAAVNALAAAAVDAVGGMHAQISRSVVDIYQRVTTQTAAQVSTGVLTRLQASQAALDRYAREGVTGFTDKAGRRWQLPSYAEMATRTMAGQAAVQGHVDTLQAHGVGLVICSDAPQECVLCRPWEGKVLALSPTGLGRHEGRGTSVMVTATLAEAVAAGWQHPNCRHTVSAYQVGFTAPITGTQDPAGDKARQRQRYLERQVRAAKRQQAAAMDPLAAKAAAAKVRARQSVLREHVAEHDLTRRREREQITTAR